MKASAFSDAQKAFILKQGADGVPVGLETVDGAGHFMLRRARLWHKLAAEHLVRTLLDSA